MFVDTNDPAALSAFRNLQCSQYVNINSIHPQDDRLFGTETLCGDYSGRLLVLAQDFSTADRVRERKGMTPERNPFYHRQDNDTNETLVGILRELAGRTARSERLGSLNTAGYSAAECGVVYGSIIWLLKDTPKVSSPLPHLREALATSKPVIDGAIQAMPKLDRIVCLGRCAYEGLALMQGLRRDWRDDLEARRHFEIAGGACVFPTSHLGKLGLAQRGTRDVALAACRDDFMRALA